MLRQTEESGNLVDNIETARNDGMLRQKLAERRIPDLGVFGNGLVMGRNGGYGSFPMRDVVIEYIGKNLIVSPVY